MKDTNKALAICFLLLAVTASVTGFLGLDNNQQSSEELNQDQGIDTSNIDLGTSFNAEMKATEANQQALTKAHPIPKMENSLERENLKKRYETLNDRDKVFHVYLMSFGKVVSYFPAQGKVSSVNSKLTQPEQLIPCDRTDGNFRGEDCVVSSPQLDGSYGTNGDAVFFYTTDGSYVEWNGEYMVSERPLNIQTPVSLQRDVTE